MRDTHAAIARLDHWPAGALSVRCQIARSVFVACRASAILGTEWHWCVHPATFSSHWLAPFTTSHAASHAIPAPHIRYRPRHKGPFDRASPSVPWAGIRPPAAAQSFCNKPATSPELRSGPGKPEGAASQSLQLTNSRKSPQKAQARRGDVQSADPNQDHRIERIIPLWYCWLCPAGSTAPAGEGGGAPGGRVGGVWCHSGGGGGAWHVGARAGAAVGGRGGAGGGALDGRGRDPGPGRALLCHLLAGERRCRPWCAGHASPHGAYACEVKHSSATLPLRHCSQSLPVLAH